MKYERINKNYTKIIISFIVIIIIGSVLVLNITKAKYRKTISIPIVSGTIKYSGGYDFKIMSLYQQKKDKSCTKDECYDPVDEMPESGYVINKERSYCTLDGQVKEYDKLYTNGNGEHIFKNLKKNEKCYLYFDTTKSSKDVLTLTLKREQCKSSQSFSSVDTSEHKGNNSKTCLYLSEDDFGDSYYFRGKVEDNWVKFGKMGSDSGNDIYWRIVRINGDGTIRLIYSGNGSPSSIGSQTNAMTGIKFNNASENNMYVGYQYESGNAHGYGLDKQQSNVLTQLNTWFKNNLKDEWNDGNGRIDANAGFCNDRSNSTSKSTTWAEDMSEGGGTEKIDTYYGGYLRLSNNNKQPTLKCSTNIHKNEDYFTYTNAIGIKQKGINEILTGTKSLEYPIGLITADEVSFAGGVENQANAGYWLHTGQDYWTITPMMFQNSLYAVALYIIYSDGSISGYFSTDMYGLRPVINLKADTEFTGDGTSTNPYIVS